MSRVMRALSKTCSKLGRWTKGDFCIRLSLFVHWSGWNFWFQIVRASWVKIRDSDLAVSRSRCRLYRDFTHAQMKSSILSDLDDPKQPCSRAKSKISSFWKMPSGTGTSLFTLFWKVFWICLEFLKIIQKLQSIAVPTKVEFR